MENKTQIEKSAYLADVCIYILRYLICKALFVSNDVENAYTKVNVRYKTPKYLVAFPKEEVRELDCSSKTIR